jgi:predicted Zn-dependent protease
MKTFAALATALLLTGPAAAETFTHATAGLQFELPDGWTTKQDGDTLEAEGPGGLPSMQFDVIADAEVEHYVDGWAQGAGETFQEMEVTTDAKPEKINGLQQTYSEGTAKVDGQPIQWDLTIVQGGKKTLAIMAFGDDLDAELMKSIYRSIRKAR